MERHVSTGIHATTILCVRKDGRVVMGGDGQVTVGDTIMKSRANKVRVLGGGKVLAGFAGAAADAFTLFEKFEEKLERFPSNLPRASVELAIPCLTSLDTARALLLALSSRREGEEFNLVTINDYAKMAGTAPAAS